MNNTLQKFILTESEKYDNDSAGLKKLFNYYFSVGEPQLLDKDSEYRKLYNIARGVINPEDYIDDVTPQEKIIMGDVQLETTNLMFFPIAPNIFNGILNENDKKYAEYTVYAVNPEASNDVVEKMNTDLRDSLVTKALNLFMSANEETPPDVLEEKVKLFQEGEKIQKYYRTEYKSTFEQWCQHMMAWEDGMFDMKGLERKVLEQILTTDQPTVHIEHIDGKYYPEVLPEKDCFYLKSPNTEDYSQSMMFGWVTQENAATIINKYGSQLSDEDLEKVHDYIGGAYGGDFVINHQLDRLGDVRRRGYEESLHNYLAFKNLEANTGYSAEENKTGNTLCRVVTIYFLLPRKVGVLTVAKDGVIKFKDIVDEQFKITEKPVYKSKKKTVENLVDGEHVDWFYKNELFRGRRLDLVGRNTVGVDKFNTTDDNNIWLEIGKHEVQPPYAHSRYGVSIPVHGGSTTSAYNRPVSIIGAIKPYQVMYNWLWNRNNQLLATEIGSFFMFPDGIVPDLSVDGSWDENALSKFALTARDTGLAPYQVGLNSGINPQLGFSGVGQKVDLTKTQEVMEKANLARLIKEEAYQTVGLSPQYLFGNISPQQSAKSAALGNQRSATQIQHVFTRLGDVMRRVRTTMLETAKMIAIKNPTAEISYQTSEGAKEIFRASTDNFPLYEIGIFIKSNVSELDVIETIKGYVIGNNTMGINPIEMATLFTFKSIPELFTKLKELKVEKEINDQKEFEKQQALQQQQLEAQRELQAQQLQAQEQRDAIKHERELELTQIRALGYANSTAEEIRTEIERILADQKSERDFVDKVNYREQKDRMSMEQFYEKMDEQRIGRRTQEMIKLKELELRAQELEAQKQRTEAMKIDKS